MPDLDRPVTLRLFARWANRSEPDGPGPAEPTDHAVWSLQEDAGTRPDFGDRLAGLRRVRTFVVRWRPELERADARLIRIVDEYGITWYTDSVSLFGDRRRFISLAMSTPQIQGKGA